MRKQYKKLGFQVEGIRRYLEPGPIVLVSSSYKGESNIMTIPKLFTTPATAFL